MTEFSLFLNWHIFHVGLLSVLNSSLVIHLLVYQFIANFYHKLASPTVDKRQE